MGNIAIKMIQLNDGGKYDKKIKQFKDSFNEEKARVRLYKSGKN